MKYKIIFILLFIFSVNSFSQEPSFKSKIDTNNVLIGDQINLLLEFQSNKKINVIFPILPDSIGKLEVISRTKIDTVLQEGLFKLSQKFTITSFDSGAYNLDPVTLFFEKEGSDNIPLFSEQFVLKFSTVPVDTAQGFKDIKGVLDVPIPWTEYLIYIIIAALAVALTFVGIYFYRKYKNKPKIEDLGYDPSIPPYILAFESLKQLDSEKLWQKGYVKEYYIRLTDIIRLYIQRQLKIDAPEMITDEIVDSLRKFGIESSLVIKMRTMFENADLAKFAKSEPLPDVNTLCLSIAFEFLTATNIKTNEQEKKGE